MQPELNQDTDEPVWRISRSVFHLGVLTLIIQQSMLHNASSCTFWNTQAAGRGRMTAGQTQRRCVFKSAQQGKTTSEHAVVSKLDAHADQNIK